jgi:hypothetical protein
MRPSLSMAIRPDDDSCLSEMSTPDGALGVMRAQSANTSLRTTPTPLAQHRASGATMGAFAGWDMPLEYSAIVQEHLAVRTRGLVDVSHMGDIEFAGTNALAAIQQGP